MAESAVSFLLNQLTIWLQQEQQLLGGLKSDVEFIRGEMGQMNAFLRVADAKEESDPQLKEWVRQVREIAYDTEEILDKYMLLQFAQRDAAGVRGRISKIYAPVKNLKFRREIASHIQGIRSRVEDVSKSQKRFRDLYDILDQGSTSNPPGTACYDGRSDALFLEAAEVVGFDEPKKQLLEWIYSTDNGLTVISVVGMGGLGKTTLVKKVYDDEKLKASFHHHAWIAVSESFKIEHILVDIIRQLVKEVKQPPPQGLEVMKVDAMREFISDFLRHKNYIIVLDDVWRINAWEAIKYTFPRGSRSCGRIIITTRFSNIGMVASIDGKNGHVYHLKPLSEEDSEKLFHRKAFQGKPCPPYLEHVCESILKRCEGLPLAIVVIGGLLATKNNSIENWNMLNRSLGHELLESDSLKRMTKLISLSYYDLPYHLKSCFLYLSIFPEDEVIEEWRLVRLWIAEGFVQEKAGKTLEETARGYINELLNRNLILVANTTRDGMPKEFRVHDIVREYIVSKSREQIIVATSCGGEFQWLNKIRRLAIISSFNFSQESFDFKYLRSLLWFSSADSEFGSVLINRLLCGGSRLLKVLDFRGAPLSRIPDEVFKLYLLKYLSLRDTEVGSIPESIKYLQNLETLDLKRTKVTELPVQIVKLLKLRHLLLYSYNYEHGSVIFDSKQGFKAPFEIGSLSSLQKLAYIDVNGVVERGTKIVVKIGKLSQLRRLGIVKLKREGGKDLCCSLAKLANLRSLSIVSISDEEIMDLDHSMSPDSTNVLTFLQKLELRGRLERVPQWVLCLDGLTVLWLRWSKLREDPLRAIQGLPNLVFLQMMAAYEGERLSLGAGGFPKLEKLELVDMRGLRWIRMEMGSLPLLKKMVFRSCKSLEEVPMGIEHLTNLQEVLLALMPKKIVYIFTDWERRCMPVASHPVVWYRRIVD